MALTLVTPPTGNLLEKQELLDWVRADDIRANAAEVARLVKAAESSFQEYTGRVLRQSTWKWTRSLFSGRPMRLPLVPVRSISLVRYKDAEGDWTTIDAADYQTRADELFTYLLPAPLLTWPTVGTEYADAVEITFVAGMVATGIRPDEEILVRIKMYVARFFQKRLPDFAIFGLDAAKDDWLFSLWAPWSTGEMP
jgi:uncharacterized phiE125 gp8 family phage protein